MSLRRCLNFRSLLLGEKERTFLKSRLGVAASGGSACCRLPVWATVIWITCVLEVRDPAGGLQSGVRLHRPGGIYSSMRSPTLAALGVHPCHAHARVSPVKLSWSRQKDPETDTLHVQHRDELSCEGVQEGFLEEGTRKLS